MAAKRARAFLDANVLIRGVTFPRFPYEVLRHAARGDFVAILSPLVVDSARLYVARLFPEHLDDLEVLLSVMPYERVPDPPPEEVAAHARLVRDPKDVPVALAAIRAGAEYLVSTDRDFTDEDETTAELRRYIRPIKVGTFLREVMGWTSEELTAIERRCWLHLDVPFWKEE